MGNHEIKNELLYQHIQFKRIEKFTKNYLDAGQVVSEKIILGKLMHEILYFDGTNFVGEMDIEEESNFAFKEGQGKLKRGNFHQYYT